MIDIAWSFIRRESVLPMHPPLRKESKDGPYLSGGKYVPNQKVQDLRDRLIKFMEDHIYPMENEFYKLAFSSKRWSVHPEEEKLKELAKKEGLWNLFIPVCAAANKLLSFPIEVVC